MRDSLYGFIHFAQKVFNTLQVMNEGFSIDDVNELMMMKWILEMMLVFRTCVSFGHCGIFYISLDTLCSMGSEEILDSYYVL